MANTSAFTRALFSRKIRELRTEDAALRKEREVIQRQIKQVECSLEASNGGKAGK